MPARDYSVVARVSVWCDRLRQSRLAATGCPACALGWTPQAQAQGTYRLEACVARFYAARPALCGSRTSEGFSAFDARSPPIGVIFPAKGGVFRRLRFWGEFGGAPTDVGHAPKSVI